MIVTTDLPPDWGGIQRVVHELASRLAPRWSVTVVAPHNPASHEYDPTVGFRVLRTSAAWSDSKIRCLAEMTRLVLGNQADLLLAAHVNVLPPLWLAHPTVPKVVLLYGNELWAPRSRAVARLLARRVERAMAISRFTAAEAAKIGISRLSVTPLAASPPASNGDPRLLDELGLVSKGGTRPFFLTISRLAEPHKGHDVFLRALPEIVARHPETRYVIAGEGPLAPAIRSLAAELGVGHAVRMLGAVDEATKGILLRACLAYVMVSRELRRPALFEGFGITYLEAAFAGRPSLAGATGGVSDAVADGETGLLVDPTSVEAVTRAALCFLDEPEYADRLGRAARERAERGYTWDLAIARMEGILHEAIGCR